MSRVVTPFLAVMIAASVVLLATGYSAAQTARIAPDTGELIDVPPVIPPSSRLRQRPDELPPLVERRSPKGGFVVDLGERFYSYTVATINADGKLVNRCLNHPPMILSKENQSTHGDIK